MASSEGGVEAVTIAALREMRRARRRRYVERVDLMEALYRVYVGIVFGVIGFGVLAGVLHEAPATAAAVEWLRQHGPATLGMIAAVAIFAGLRAGAYGGPLAIEAAEVQYALMAPLRRGVALRGTALRQLRTGAVWGVVLGAVVGNFAFRRLPGSPVEWIVCLASFSALVPVCFLAAAQVASGRRWGVPRAGLVGLLLVAWSGADLLLGGTSSPATLLGELAVLPLKGAAGAALAGSGVALVAGLAGLGLHGVGGIRLEAARRRAALAAELRFSAMTQDLRTIVLLRRQLASERPRRRPWIDLKPREPARNPILRRGCQSFLRWPAARLVRVVSIGAASGVLAVAAWSAAPLALFVPGLLLFVAGLDLIEPVAQESDHPTRRQLLPLSPASLIVRHLAAPAIATTLVLSIATAAASAAGGGVTAIFVGLLLCAPVGLVIACCAAFSATADPYAYAFAPQMELMPPIGYLVAAAPPMASSLAVAAPLFAAREAERSGGSAEAIAMGSAISLAVTAASAAHFLGQKFARRDA